MTATSSLTAAAPPEMTETVLAYVATNNILSVITIITSLVFVFLQFDN